MKLPVSDKTSSFGVKPHIKKGYYPGKLLSVQEFKDKNTNQLKVGKYGHQLIFEFAVYKADPETDAPIAPMQYLPDPENLDEKKDVIIAKFVYHTYRAKNPKEGEPEFQTAITPNSAITKLLKALGWEFNADDDVDPESFVDTWVELNIDDYEYEQGDEKLVASTIKDVNPYKGPKVGKVREAEKQKPKDVKKQVKHEAVEKAEEKSSEEESPEIEEKKAKIAQMEKLNKEGLLSDDGLKQAKEQLEAQIDELRKKK